MAGVNAETPPDIQVAVWMKFLLISVWSVMGAVTRAPVGIFVGLGFEKNHTAFGQGQGNFKRFFSIGLSA
jgi:hypothetical protein